MPELFVNGKDAVAVVVLQELEVHGGGALLAVFDAAAYHLFDVLHFNSPGMEGILNYFIVVIKNLLQDVHGIIMR